MNGCYGLFAPAETAMNIAYQFSCGRIDDIPLRDEQFVLVGTGQAAKWMSRNIEQPLKLSTSSPISGIDFMVGGSHALIVNGEPGELSSHLTLRLLPPHPSSPTIPRRLDHSQNTGTPEAMTPKL